MLRLEILWKKGGDAMHPDSLFEDAWENHIECQGIGKLNWATSQREYITDMDRFELLAFDGDKLVGAMVLAFDEDEVHVGRCCYVAFAYMLPAYRGGNAGAWFYRTALRITKNCGYPVLAYTHRVRDWEYLVRYIRIKRTIK